MVHDVEVFNNGRGWRIAITLAAGKIILTKAGAEILLTKIKVALLRLEGRDT
jgi:hypothetical protein